MLRKYYTANLIISDDVYIIRVKKPCSGGFFFPNSVSHIDRHTEEVYCYPCLTPFRICPRLSRNAVRVEIVMTDPPTGMFLGGRRKPANPEETLHGHGAASQAICPCEGSPRSTTPLIMLLTI